MLDADIDPDVRIQSLSRTEKSLVAIARALAAEAEVLVLDEPTASLPADEVARLFVALRRLRDRGVGIIYVSHRLDEVFMVLHGRVAGERQVDQTTPEEVILLIVGREPSQVFRRSARRMGQPRMALQSVMVGEIGPVDCELHAGGVVGFVGLRGAGQGNDRQGPLHRRPRQADAFCWTASRVAPATPRQAMANGINLVCADRASESLAPNLTIREDLFLNRSRPACAFYRCSAPPARTGPAISRAWPAGRPAAERSAAAIELLSGGNQQKVVVGRWLHLAGKVYVFRIEQPVSDVGAKAEIYRLFDAALNKRRGNHHHLDRDFEEVAKVLPSRLGLRPRPSGIRTRRYRSRGRKPAGGGVRERRADGGNITRRACPCSLLNRTRWSLPGPSLPRCRVVRRSPGCSRSTACRS